MIRVDHLEKRFGKKVAVQDITLTLERGVYGLLGPNGAGKTTLMRTILGLYKPDGGQVRWGEANARGSDFSFGYLPQQFMAFEELTVEETLAYFATLKKIPKSQRNEEVARCLKLVRLTGEAKKKMGALSGGMVRRIGIAQALLGNPSVVFFDEPTAGLDPEERMNFKMCIAEIKKQATVLISTHIVSDVEGICDHILILHNGRLAATGTRKEIEEIARGKVWVVPAEAKRESTEGHWHLINVYEQDGQEWMRVLSGEQLAEGKLVQPNVEDGYFCCIRGIGGESR
ncbi:ABC transporter ATP-binding protein [Bittarella massiliensis (ex Durand et al. 2017)]|uniref:ABC transporter ATP-binding protein n=1 Tax=Bittarella massiliensis (ex Durand et al. 2017) TaxID=1720313 RepID=UPI001AA16601|nr:ATP-binding cassette domain-containing protein [Bittarella massiliensis (ex Durand et al. 2017)]MBO1679866.1 ATP-binding cassette domain-containing protein [Bittarella massiliensis (ex Durand et al. 2017)]